MAGFFHGGNRQPISDRCFSGMHCILPVYSGQWTGHCNLRQYRHRFGREEDPYCDCGDGSIENVEYYLLSCSKYDRQREKLRKKVGCGGMWMEKLLGHPRLIKYTLEFVEETGVMKINQRNET